MSRQTKGGPAVNEEDERGSELVHPPRASALIEAMRDIGYSFEAAVADIVDNSLAAGARTIDVRFGWEGDEPWFAILDDGTGMSRQSLLDAMRPGSRSPLLPRSKGDLGRFGLGLKTASFSQCRELSVITRHAGAVSAMRWDLDLVRDRDEWNLLELATEDLRNLPVFAELPAQGTLVLWRKVDRLSLTGHSNTANIAFNEVVGVASEHLARVFHRFIAGEPGKAKIAFRVNGSSLSPFDPFNETNRATLQLPEEVVTLPHGEVRIQAFILPHHSKTSPSDYARLAGPEGYLRNQGFYVYRNRRLIIWGTWFRLAKQEELTKLARVRIDIPNTLDHVWGIDVRKSRAHPPGLVKMRLKQVIEQIRGSAKRPYTHRGTVLMDKKVSPVWVRRAFNDHLEYSLNESHPLIEDVLRDLGKVDRARVESLLKLIASSFPAASFFSDYASEPRKLEQETADIPLLGSLARLMRDSNPGMEPQELRQMLGGLDPFCRWPKDIDAMVAEAFKN